MKKYLYILVCMLMTVVAQTAYGKATYKPKEVKSYCKGEEDPGYKWHDKYYKTTGEYQFVELSSSGDSTVYTLDLTVNMAFDSIIELPICEHGSVVYDGITYTEETEKEVFKGKTADGCDSIIRLKVFFAPSFHRYDTIELSYHRPPAEWHGMVITGPGRYMDSHFNVYGCDSTYELFVTMADTISFLHITKDVICEKDTQDYDWRGHKYSNTGVIMEEEKYKAQDGTDSIYSLYLIIQPQYEFTYNINLCPNTSVEYRGKTYTQDSVGVHYDTLYTAGGCDSVCKITVAMLEGGKLEEVTLKPGGSYLWNLNGQTYTSAGRYAYPEEPITSDEGCDLTNYLLITVTPTFNLDPLTHRHCRTPEEPTYLWRGKHYAETGTYYDTVRVLNLADQDTVYTLILTVGDSKETHEYMELCRAGEDKTWHDYPVTEAGDFPLHLTTREGCDSTVILHVTNNLVEDIFDTLPYAYRKQWYEHTVGGTDTTYIHYVPTNEPDMCDTLKRLHIALCYPFKANMSDTICETRLIAGEVYMWEDEDGTKVPLRLHRDANLRYHDSVFYTCEEDKDLRLSFHLHVLRERIYMDTINLCEGELDSRVLSDGRTVWFSEPGRTYDTIPDPGRGRYNCDSVVCYFVRVHKPKRDTAIVHVPDTTTLYIWDIEDKQIPLPVVKELGYQYFNDTVVSTIRSTCDSIIHTLKLITDTTYLYVDSKQICKPYYHGPGDPRNTPYIWEGHLKNGKTYEIYEEGVYWDSLRTKNTNVDSVYKLVVTIYPTYHYQFHQEICQGESITSPLGKVITKKGIYYDTLLTSAHGCDSIIEWVVNEKPSYEFHIDTAISTNQTPYIWKCYDADGTPHIRTLTNSGEYIETLRSSRECDSTLHLHLTIHPSYNYKKDTMICASETPFEWHGRQFWKDTVYLDTLQTVMLQDSIIELTLTVIDTTHSDIYYSICTGEAIVLNNKTYNHGGMYRDTVYNRLGCDSVLIIHVEELPVEMRSVEVNSNKPYTWAQNGMTYDVSGLYYDTIPAVGKGCDTIMRLVLTMYDKEQIREESIEVCERELPYQWHTKWLNHDTIVWYTVHSELVDTIWRLDFKVIRMERDSINKVLCEGEPYSFNGQTFTRDTAFRDTVYTGYGCGKIYVVNLKFRDVHTYEHNAIWSDQQPYIWEIEDATYTIKTDISAPQVDYTHSVRTKDGLCDSILHVLHLTIGKTYLFKDTVHLCLPDTIYWRGQKITDAGFYQDSLRTQLGYDSVYHLIATADRDTVIYEYYNILAGTQLTVHGIDISQPGVYTDKLISQNGCDSIYQITVNTKRTLEVFRDTTICEGDYCIFYGLKLTVADTYTYISPAEDSIVYLTLHVNPKDITEEYIVITADQLPYLHNKTVYDSAGLYEKHLENVGHCDSIVRTKIVVTEHYSEWDFQPLCPGGEIKYRDSVITKSGSYTFINRSRITGELDSLYRMEVYDAPAYDLPTETIIICEGDTAEYAGERFTRAGLYDIKLQTVDGHCDSIMHAQIIVNKTYHHYDNAIIADYQSYTWNGKAYTEEGAYHYTLPSVNNCDSIFTLDLKVVETQRFIAEDTICEGQIYKWRGQDYSIAGYYTDTIFRPETSYSAIYTLQLTTLQPTTITHTQVNDICANANYFDIEFTYTGARPTTYSIYFDQLAKDEGFQDVINEPLLGEDHFARALVPSKKMVVYEDNTAYVRPNKYSMSLILDNGSCGVKRADSIYILVKYPSWIIEQNWNDVVAPLKPELNGGYTFDHNRTEWYVNGFLISSSDLGYLHYDQLKPGDEVVMKAIRKGENTAIPTCPLIISYQSTPFNEYPVLVFPTQASHRAPAITIKAPQSGSYAIYSSQGVPVSSGELNEGQQQVILPNNSGIYFIRTTQGNETETHKVVLY